MSLLEWLGEPLNPGPVSVIDHDAPTRPALPRGLLLIRGLLGLGVIALGVIGALSAAEPGRWLGLFAAYLLISPLVQPKPDYSNVGWLGGLVDHPFRFSDDINRFLIFALVVLWPGRFAVTATRDGLKALTA